MLLNFVTDSDLEAYYSDVVSFRRGGQLDYADTITKAYQTVIRDVVNRGFNPRKLMIPIDLNRDASTSPNYQHLTSATESSTTNGYAHQGRGREGRIVVTVSDRTANTAWDFILQGSNEKNRPDDASTYWENIQTISITTEGEGETNYRFTSLYKWYRLRLVLNTGPGSITYTAAIYETAFDDLIVNKAIELICSGWHTGLSGQWQFRLEKAMSDYASGLDAVKFGYDEDEDGVPEEHEEMRASVRLRR